MLWTANTERYADVIEGINDTPENFLAAVAANHAEVAPSQLYALASVLEGCPFINGSPQNTFVPGLLRLAVEKGVLVGGDDFKSGQTKMKSVLVDFLVGAGIKPTSIVSYNHLGNNDGKNLSAPQTFRSKEISKANVVDDMVREREGGGGGEEDEERAFFLIEFLSFFSRDASPEKERKNLNLQKKKNEQQVHSNNLLYSKQGEHPDHVVVIKYVPAVGDSKRAMDEYTSEIFMVSHFSSFSSFFSSFFVFFSLLIF